MMMIGLNYGVAFVFTLIAISADDGRCGTSVRRRSYVARRRTDNERSCFAWCYVINDAPTYSRWSPDEWTSVASTCLAPCRHPTSSRPGLWAAIDDASVRSGSRGRQIWQWLAARRTRLRFASPAAERPSARPANGSWEPAIEASGRRGAAARQWKQVDEYRLLGSAIVVPLSAGACYIRRWVVVTNVEISNGYSGRPQQQLLLRPL